LIALADALDVDLTELVGKRPRLDRRDNVSVLALRDTVLSPEFLFEHEPLDAEPPAVDELRRAVEGAWADYWAGRFSHLAATLPRLVEGARMAHRALGPEMAPVLAQAYQLIASMLVHLGKDDLALVGAERAIAAAAEGSDELLWATTHGTYSWILLHQGRTDVAERHAIGIAERIEPSIGKSTLEHLTVWGALVLWAMAAAVAGGRKQPATDYIGLARAAAGRFDRDRHDYNTNFGPTQVAMQATHAYSMLGEPGRALKAATQVRREDLFRISVGRHLLDVAQAHVDARNLRAAEHALIEADGVSTEWFRHQGPARALVADLVHEARRLSPPLRRLARSAGVDS
jgi:hypothetical protein